MRAESGVSVITLVAGLAVIAAAGAGYFAWESTAQLGRVQNELEATKNSLNKLRIDTKQATQDLAVASKDAKELKIATDRLTGERDAVRKSLENEQAAGVQLRADLELAKLQVSYLSARTSKDVVRGMPKTVAAK